MTLHLLLSLMAFLALASGKAQRRPSNWIPQRTQPTPDYSDYSETDPKDLPLNRQRCECSPEPRSQNRMLSQSETELPEGKDYQFSSPWGGNNLQDGKDYQFSTNYHPGGHQLGGSGSSQGPYSGYNPSGRLSSGQYSPGARRNVGGRIGPRPSQSTSRK